MHIDIGRRKDRKIYGREVLTLPIYYETIESKKKRTKANENKKKVIKIKYETISGRKYKTVDFLFTVFSIVLQNFKVRTKLI